MRYEMKISGYDDDGKQADSFYYELDSEQYNSIVQFLVEGESFAVPVENVAKTLANFTKKRPCDFDKGLQESNKDYFCDYENCGSRSFDDCWLHAIKEGWLDE